MATSSASTSSSSSAYCAACGAALRPEARFCVECGARAVAAADKGEAEKPQQPARSKAAATALALLLGGVGAHKLYLGYKTEGLIMFALTVYGIAASRLWGVALVSVAVVGVALVEAVIYGTMPDAQFEETYVESKRPWLLARTEERPCVASTAVRPSLRETSSARPAESR